jgi:peroxiredoxin
MYAFDDYVNADGSKITMAADPFGEVSEQLGLLTEMGLMGKRCKRFSSYIADGKMQKLFVDERELEHSTAENMLAYLKN